MYHPQYVAILTAMQKLKPTMHQRARQNGRYPYKHYLAHEWVKFLTS